MEIKSYRAATLREALLQIKEELGEDALVIETKQIRAGGFLGVGARDLVEVRVAPGGSPAARAAKQAGAAKTTGEPERKLDGKLNGKLDGKPAASAAKRNGQTGRSGQLNLTEDSAAAPSAKKTLADEDADFLVEMLKLTRGTPKRGGFEGASKDKQRGGFETGFEADFAAGFEAPAARAEQRAEKKPAPSKDELLAALGLNQRDKAAFTNRAKPAPPLPEADIDEKQALGAFAALAARAFMGKENGKASGQESGKTSAPESRGVRPFADVLARKAERNAAAQRERRPIEHQPQRVELAETAPRIVHRRNADVAATLHRKPAATPKPTTLSASPAGEPVLPRTVSSELARLRAEMREMKFALGALQTRPVPQPPARRALEEREANPALYDSPNYEIFLALRSAGLSEELAQQAVLQGARLKGPEPRDIKARACAVLAAAMPNWLPFSQAALAMQEAAAFIGPTGVGKTTTIAKLAAHIALRARRPVELITLDTYRIAAIQQLKTYAEIIGAGCHVAHSVVELDALTRRFAQKATVLIDTTGRSPHDLADQMELADYLRSNKSLLKCLVLPATTQPEDGQLARDKFALYGVNRLVLTKLDETVQPGATVGVAALAQLPLMYLCAGQRVPEDLERATPASFAHRVLRPKALAPAA